MNAEFVRLKAKNGDAVFINIANIVTIAPYKGYCYALSTNATPGELRSHFYFRPEGNEAFIARLAELGVDLPPLTR